MHLTMAAENWDPLFVISQTGYSGVMSKVLEYLQSNITFPPPWCGPQMEAGECPTRRQENGAAWLEWC